MRNDDAKKVLKMMLEADSGCNNCASSLFCDFIKAYPEYKDLAKKLYSDEFSGELEDL